MEFISPHKCIKNISTNGIVLTEHLLNTSRGPLTFKKTRKNTAKLGRTKEIRKEKEEKRKRDGTCTPGRELKERRDSHIRGSSLTNGRSSETEAELWGLRGDCRNWSMAGRTE